MKLTISYTILGIFLLTCIVTYLAYSGRIRIAREYLGALFLALALELVAAGITYSQGFLQFNPLAFRGDLETLESFKNEAIRDQLGIPTVIEVIAAITRKDLTTLDAYLARGFAVNEPLDAKQSTALHIAAVRCQAEVIDYLLQKGADPSLKNSAQTTALQVAEASCGVDSSSSQLLRAALP